MKHTLLTLALLFASFSANAATVVTQPGTLIIVYTNDAGAAAFSPSAAINNAAATQWVTWCETHYSNTPTANTSLGCFNTWADDVFNQMVQGVKATNAAAAAATAAASATGPTITPAQ